MYKICLQPIVVVPPLLVSTPSGRSTDLIGYVEVVGSLLMVNWLYMYNVVIDNFL